jgi:hypothetical protein
MADLTDGTLLHAINLDENREPVSGEGVWTGTDSDGTRSGEGEYCAFWSSEINNDEGQVGGVDFTTEFWTNDGEDDCTSDRRLYCFADATSN